MKYHHHSKIITDFYTHTVFDQVVILQLGTMYDLTDYGLNRAINERISKAEWHDFSRLIDFSSHVSKTCFCLRFKNAAINNMPHHPQWGHNIIVSLGGVVT